jgi:ABC-type Mn2+/Zn2+ transport system permease subunit
VAPLLLAQTEPRALLAYRNAAVILLSRPVASWGLILVWLGVLVFASATALATVIGLALAASIQQNTLRLSLPNPLPAQDALARGPR